MPEYGAPENITDPVMIAKNKMLDKMEQQRRRDEEEREAHITAEQIRAEQKALELEELLDEAHAISPTLPIQIRMAAYEMGINANLYGNGRKLQLDERAIAIAKYALRGEI